MDVDRNCGRRCGSDLRDRHATKNAECDARHWHVAPASCNGSSGQRGDVVHSAGRSADRHVLHVRETMRKTIFVFVLILLAGTVGAKPVTHTTTEVLGMVVTGSTLNPIGMTNLVG